MKIDFEETQHGNPYELTKKQHFIPNESIKRFSDNNGKVQVKHLKTKKQQIVCTSPDDEIFWVTRLWDQRAENGYMKKIEDAFQGLVDKVIQNEVTSFDDTQNKIICDMYTLWECRILCIEEFLKNPKLFVQLSGIDGETLTKNEQEILESKHFAYVTENVEIPNRSLIGDQCQLKIIGSPYKNIKWGILKSSYKEFVMSSNPIIRHNENPPTIIFPISPFYCIVSTVVYQVVDDKDIEELNSVIIQNSKWFYFGRNLKK
ncbi:DUF4238 domain-containing protein [Sulfuricurvum sp.]|uniref:DUF4238 domain-containing protein n=1 Tax=Sulfuricurvum sp. TaxID=2025608 RepID=UPI00286DB0B1|nr:DUF4238 domain-containing protein [Sulfuricurvum sp.]